MAGKATILAGGTGTGKTSFMKERLDNINPGSLFLYDVNQEYRDYYKKPLIKFDQFAEQSSKIRNGVIVYEEATIFLSNRGSNDYIREVLVKKRHQNNTIFFIFHSMRAVPRWVYDLCNYVVLFKTNDSESVIENRFENELLTETFRRVQKNSINNSHYHEVFSIY